MNRGMLNSKSFKVENCRICSTSALISILDMGNIPLTGHFSHDGKSVSKMPLNLGQCENCGLVQLLHSYAGELLYGQFYGYESHLNSSMRRHLHRKASLLEQKFLTGVKNPRVLDIASNDGTLLSGYKNSSMTRIGVDPILKYLEDYYPFKAIKIPKFFDENIISEVKIGSIDLVTSLSVIYDLNDPIAFAKTVNLILKEGGVWHFEQSYLPSMLESLSYDTICHEHLLYLSMRDIVRILDESGFSVLEVTQNSVNGGSLAITAIKGRKQENHPYVSYLLNKENQMGIMNSVALKSFGMRVLQHREEAKRLILEYKKIGFRIYGLGASTKGNVFLNYANLSSEEIDCIGDINPKKFGKKTPGTNIEILPESEVVSRSNKQALYLILPWHFRENIISNCSIVLENHGSFLIPFPSLEVVSS